MSYFVPSNPKDSRQTTAEYQAWDASRDSIKDDFPDIYLNKKEENLLRSLTEDDVLITDKNRTEVHRLLNLVFLRTFKTDHPKKENIEFCQIRTRGREYLAYLDGKREDTRKEHRHNWLIAIFSSVAGALLSRPIWIGIDWIINLLRKLLQE